MSLLPPEPLPSKYAQWKWSVASEWPDLATTWRLDDARGTSAYFVKVGRSGHYPTVLDDRDRTEWAGAVLPVPPVVESGSDGTVDWLVTRALEGTDATRHPLRADPERLVPALARGLARFHTAPVASCPFRFTVPEALEHVRTRVREGIAKPGDLHPEHEHLSLDDALRELDALAPAGEDLVVCHGDYCLPNVLLDGAGTVTGFVDLGELAVADRWWDLAIGAWSVTWNVGPGWEPLFYDSYGVRPDARRIAFFRLLYDLAS